MSPWKPILALFFLSLLCWASEGKTGSTTTWSCPDGWKAFTAKGPIQCLWASPTPASSYKNAEDVCQALESNLLSIFREEKWKFVGNLIRQMNDAPNQVYIGLSNDRYQYPKWNTANGEKAIIFSPPGFQANYHRPGCFVMHAVDGSWMYDNCYNSGTYYICEKDAVCKPSWFGSRCENQCHCHGHPCGARTSNVTCLFGCEKGWMGSSCHIKREKATVAYHCVNQGDGDKHKHVAIEIDTKNIAYRGIHPFDEKKTTIQWCNDTEIVYSQDLNSINIKIWMTEDSIKGMNQGLCAGQLIGGDSYKWHIVLQEWEGINMPTDQTILVTCNFSEAETLSRAVKSKVTGNKAPESSKPEETKEKVILELADAATKRKLLFASFGAPVILQIRLDLDEGSTIKSVAPYNCEATSADGTRRIHLLDANGCKVDGSPVQPFKIENNTIVTPWFPYFAFPGSPNVHFHCSFIFCYDDSCQVGCHIRETWLPKSRHVRSAALSSQFSDVFVGHVIAEVTP